MPIEQRTSYELSSGSIVIVVFGVLRMTMNANVYEQKGQEDELVRRLREGEKSAFATLYRENYTGLCDFVHRYIGTPAICEELVQDLFLETWIRRSDLDPQGNIRSWLYKAARNRALDYLKHLKVERHHFDQQVTLHREERGNQIAEDDFISLEEGIAGELNEKIQDAIDRLPGRRRLIFLMSKEDGLTYREIAEVLDISIKTVETQMGRALKSLREMLSDVLPGLVLLSVWV